jgi:hypothetical protein
MKDLTEAMLIEMERRADALVGSLDEDPDEMSQNELADAYNDAQHRAEAIARDVAALREHARAKVTA